MGWQGPRRDEVLQELLRSGLEGRNKRGGGPSGVQNGGRKTPIGKLARGCLSLQAGKKETEFEVGVVKCLMNRAKGLKEGVHEGLKVVEHEGRVTDGSAEDFKTEKIERAATISTGSMVQVAGQGRREVRKGKGAGSRKEDAAFLLVKVKAQGRAVLREEV